MADPLLDAWATRLAAALDLDIDIDVQLLLDVARDAAHGVARPAAPLTTFLVGYAAARRGGTAADVAAVARIASSLALAQAPDGGDTDTAGSDATPGDRS